MRQLSSSLTFVFKFVAPAAWVVIVAFVVVATRDDPAAPWRDWRFAGAMLAGLALQLWIAIPLKRVRGVDGMLRVSSYWREERIPFELVVEVRQNRWINVRPVTVRLRSDAFGFGERFTFMPPSRMRLASWREDPEVAELRRLAGLAAPDGASAA